MRCVARALTYADLMHSLAIGRRGRRTRRQARRILEIRRRRPGQWPSTNAAFREAQRPVNVNVRPAMRARAAGSGRADFGMHLEHFPPVL